MCDLGLPNREARGCGSVQDLPSSLCKWPQWTTAIELTLTRIVMSPRGEHPGLVRQRVAVGSQSRLCSASAVMVYLDIRPCVGAGAVVVIMWRLNLVLSERFINTILHVQRSEARSCSSRREQTACKHVLKRYLQSSGGSPQSQSHGVFTCEGCLFTLRAQNILHDRARGSN